MLSIIEAGFPDNVDVVVIGSGPIGSMFARVITDRQPNVRVLIVEAGPMLTQGPGVHVRNIKTRPEQAAAKQKSQGPMTGYTVDRMQGPRANPARGEIYARPGTFSLNSFPNRPYLPNEDMPAASLSSCVGGMGVHWTCAVPRPGSSEWPGVIPKTELTAAFQRAEAIVGASTQLFEATPATDRLGAAFSKLFDERLPKGRKVQVLPLACRRLADGNLEWSGTDRILGPLLETENERDVALRPNTICRRIVHEGGVAGGVVLEDLITGETATVKAGVVIVAGDTFRTPQLLFASGIRPEALGRYLNDQPTVGALVRMTDGKSDAHRLPATAVENFGLDNTTATFWIPFDAGEHPFHGQAVCYSQPNGAGIEEGFVRLSWFCPKDIRAVDRIEFNAVEMDYYGMPRGEIRYGLSERDREMIERAYAVELSVAELIGPFVGGQEPTLRVLGNSTHYQGSCRMGSQDDGTSVCDHNSRVWGFTNLYVGGNCVIPTPIACNPTLTSLALAVCSADAIAGTL